jgi:hypothetical protein
MTLNCHFISACLARGVFETSTQVMIVAEKSLLQFPHSNVSLLNASA